MECELLKAGGLLPLRLEARGSAALTALLRTRSRHSHPDGEARRPCAGMSLGIARRGRST